MKFNYSTPVFSVNIAAINITSPELLKFRKNMVKESSEYTKSDSNINITDHISGKNYKNSQTTIFMNTTHNDLFFFDYFTLYFIMVKLFLLKTVHSGMNSRLLKRYIKQNNQKGRRF